MINTELSTLLISLRNMILGLNRCFFFVFLQEEVTEDDIDDSFKSMFAQLAGEVCSETPVLMF